MKKDPRMQKTIKWLSRNRNLKHQIWHLEKRRDADPLANISQYEESFRGAVGNLQEAKMINYAERNARIDELKAEQIIVKREIKTAISYVKDPTLWSLLTDRYVECMEWDDIGKQYRYSMRNIFYMHGKALPLVYPHLPKEIREE